MSLPRCCLLFLVLVLQAPILPAQPAAPTPGWVAAARAQVGVTVRYDPAYVRLEYPGGDVAADRGVCTDVVIRALRSQGLDLQQALHEDMRRNFARYPQNWGLRRPDRNIDHRRVPNLATWFARQGWQRKLPVPAERATAEWAAQLRPGDLLTWLLPGNLPHIGIVSDRRSSDGTRPLVLHNVGAGTQEEDVLERWPLTGWFRPVLGR